MSFFFAGGELTALPQISELDFRGHFKMGKERGKREGRDGKGKEGKGRKEREKIPPLPGNKFLITALRQRFLVRI